MRIKLPTLHNDQVRAFYTPGRFKAIRCGRRWGKTEFCVTEACDAAARGQLVGWFAPDYRRLMPAYARVVDVLLPIKKTSSSTEKQLTTATGGAIEMWTLADENAGRGREYNLVIVDEAAFAKPVAGRSVLEIYETAIEPTLLIRRGRVIVASNTAGDDPDNFFWQLCKNPKHGFTEYYAPSRNSPFVPPEEIARLKARKPPLVFAQEYGAEFVDWSGVAFFSEISLLRDTGLRNAHDQPIGEPYEVPSRLDAVFATIDTATKTGKKNDATAVVYWGMLRRGLTGVRLFLLDWDVIKVEGAFLETWLPGVFRNLETFAASLQCVQGSLGAWIEDKSSGMVLLQHAKNRRWPARAIDSALTSVGKSERAINVSDYVYRGEVKITRPAYQKTTTYKETTRNHLLSQVTGFRVGDDEKDKDDDLLDCFTYGIAIALGNAKGF